MSFCITSSVTFARFLRKISACKNFWKNIGISHIELDSSIFDRLCQTNRWGISQDTMSPAQLIRFFPSFDIKCTAWIQYDCQCNNTFQPWKTWYNFLWFRIDSYKTPKHKTVDSFLVLAPATNKHRLLNGKR